MNSIILTFFLVLSFGPSAFAKCDAPRGFRCDTKCPTPSAGHRYIKHNCRCKKDRPNDQCVEKGICKEYTLQGVPTGSNPGNCECEYNTTAPIMSEAEFELNSILVQGL